MSKTKKKRWAPRPAALGILLLVLLGCQQSNMPFESPVADPRGSTVSATVFFCTTPDPQCRTSVNTFQAKGLRDLFVFVAWRGVQGQHEQALQFILPDGNVYQRVAVRFDTATTLTSRGEPVVVQVLPVAGTFITQHSLLGTWAVEANLDGRPVTRASFTLQPEEQ